MADDGSNYGGGGGDDDGGLAEPVRRYLLADQQRGAGSGSAAVAVELD